MALKTILTMMLPLAFACSGGEASQNNAVAAEAPASPLQQLADRAKPGTLGVAILDLQTGQMQGLNADKPMPMQSVFKLPLGIFVFHKAAEGAFSLDEKITLTEDDISPLYSPITDRFAEKKVYTIEELVEVTVAQSDNAAADLLMKRVGGPEALTRFFQERGFEDFRVDRYEYEMQPQSVGAPAIQPRMTREQYSALRQTVPLDRQQAAMTLYLADPRDRVSPATATRMLAALDAGKLLSPELTKKMMAILEGTTSGPARLKAGIPEGAKLYHKTGTGATVDNVNGATNDIGIIALPNGRKLAVAAFLAGSTLPNEQREAVLAEVARIATKGAGAR
ncbi:MAG TPA: class A beta-lactamase [Allosphingosinicella sp.]|uniref:class A beta-lactamase n=1 Tax=Allosphingosinicella sp. TaxID=2823234 RepID=UPI002ED8A4BD